MLNEYWTCPDYLGIALRHREARRGGGGYGCPGGLGHAESDEGEKREDGGGYGSEKIEPDMLYYYITLVNCVYYYWVYVCFV